MTQPRPITLIILDGWGYREETEGNTIRMTDTPTWDALWESGTHTLIAASGQAVGLPTGQMGNSEVGHLHMGAGRLLEQELTRIDDDVASDAFFKNPVLMKTVDRTKDNGKALHIMGLLSPGGVHSHQLHIEAMAELAAKRGLKDIYIHAFLDGRDTPPKSAMASIQAMDAKLTSLHAGKIATLIGRYYAMDRDNRWPRTQVAYDMLTLGKSEYHASTAEAGLEMAYAQDETDEFVKATCIHPDNDAPVTITDGDVIVFMNFRADRARQLTHAFTDPEFDKFHREVTPRLGGFTTLTQYAKDIRANVAYQPEQPKNTFGEVLAERHLTQLRIAETEKYAHVTYFFNGGRELPFPKEERVLVPSPKVATYDLQPEMSAPEVTDKLVEAIRSKRFDAIICNYANPDMVGHTGKIAAAQVAVETVDACLAKVHAALQEVGGELLITADHGNVEQMVDHKSGQAYTAHTTNPTPLLYVGRKAEITTKQGALTDIAPTLLYLMGIPQPPEMTGKPLLTID